MKAILFVVFAVAVTAQPTAPEPQFTRRSQDILDVIQLQILGNEKAAGLFPAKRDYFMAKAETYREVNQWIRKLLPYDITPPSDP